MKRITLDAVDPKLLNPNDRKEIFVQGVMGGGGGGRLFTSQSKLNLQSDGVAVDAVKNQPLSKRLKDHLLPFEDQNRR